MADPLPVRTPNFIAPPGPPVYLLPLLQLLLATSLYSRSGILTLTFLAFQLYFLLTLPSYTGGLWSDRFAYGQNFMTVIGKSVSYLLFMRPERDFVKTSQPSSVHRDKKPGSGSTEQEGKKRQDEKSVWKRWLLALDLSRSTRGIGWGFNVKGVPDGKPKGYSRRKFVLESLATAVSNLLIIEIGASLVRRNLDRLPIPPTASFWASPLPIGILKAASIALMARWAMTAVDLLAASLTVGLGVYEPCDWPPLFGKWRDAWTVRRVWSQTWHQLLRSTTEPPLNWLMHDVLKIRRGRYVSNCGKVFGAFYWAYLLHVYGAILAEGSDCGEWHCFMGQALAIWAEEHVVKLAPFLGMLEETRTARVVGYIWTFTWLVMSTMYWTNRTCMAGDWVENPLGVMSGRVFGRLWI